jgi:uncharacterized membrane protein
MKQITHKQAKVGAIISGILAALILVGTTAFLAGYVQKFTAAARIQPSFILCLLGGIISGIGGAIFSFVAQVLGAFSHLKYQKYIVIEPKELAKDKSFYKWLVPWVIIMLGIFFVWRGQAW